MAASVQSNYVATQRVLAYGTVLRVVYCATDLNAIVTMRTSADAGRRMPKYAPVIGFDEVLSIARTTPPLTTARQDTAQAGAVLEDTLLNLIGGAPARSRLIEPELIVRESSAVLRVECVCGSG